MAKASLLQQGLAEVTKKVKKVQEQGVMLVVDS